MKNSEKKTSALKRPRKKAGTKRKRKKKLVLKDGIRAALIAGILISISALVAVSLMMANSATSDSSEMTNPVINDYSEIIDAPKITENVPETEKSAPRNSPQKNINTEKPLAVLPEKVDNKSYSEEPRKLPETVVKAVPEQPASKPIPKKPVQIVPPVKAPEPEKSIPIEKPKPVPQKQGTITLVIDDAGNNLHELDAFLAFSGPITIAVLPGLPYSAEAARRIRNAGKELILHQPMEALGGQNPGPGAINTNMTNAEIRSIVENNLAEVGPVSGMNNHQGSKATMDERVMEIILSICHDQGIYFLDSRTTADTVAPLVAKRRETPIWERDVFLDNIQEKAAMIQSFNEGLLKAKKMAEQS